MEKSHQERWNKVLKEHWWLLGRYSIVRSLIKRFAHSKENIKTRCLDIGCSGGHVMDFLRNFGETFGFDFSFDALKLFERENSKILQADAAKIPFKDGVFDLVCLFDVAEHLDDDLGLFKQIKRICAQDALIFVSVPAHMALWGSHDVKYFHKRRYSKKQLLEVVKNCGFRVKYQTFLHPHLFLPMLLFRSYDRIFNKNIGKRDDFFSSGSFLDWVFSWTMALENLFLKKWSFPFGVSIFCVLENDTD